MSYLCRFYTTTVGKKHLMGITALIWVLFVAGHLSGNLLIMVSPQAFNEYGHFLTSNHLIWVARAVLLGAFVLHVYLAVVLTLHNRAARGAQKYAMSPNGSKGVTTASKTMAYQGSLILAFVIFHIITFSLGPYYEVTYDGVVMRDLHRLVVEVFKQPAYVGWYILCLFLLGVHLSHGVGSIFQSLGLRTENYARKIRVASVAYGIVIAGGFIVLPIYVYLCA